MCYNLSMNTHKRNARSNYRAMTTGVVKDNSLYGIVTRDNDSFFINCQNMYYRRRTSFAGVFTGTYEDAQRLAKESRAGVN